LQDERFDPVKVAEDYESLVKKVRRDLRKHCESPTEENVHRARTAIRRLRASTSLLPDKVRESKDVKRYARRLEDFFSLSSKLRDTDVLMKELGGLAPHPAFALAVERLGKRREKMADRSVMIAEGLLAMKRPKIAPERIDSSAMMSRFEKRKAKLLADIHGSFTQMVSREDNAKALHEMRKATKKLRYSLELLPGDHSNQASLRSLEASQAALGRIHDRDVFIAYLRRLRQGREVSAAAEKAARLRGDEFRSFVESYRRSLISGSPAGSRSAVVTTVRSHGPGASALTRGSPSD